MHMERPREDDPSHWVETHSGTISKNGRSQKQHHSESSSEDAQPIHFTATVEGETRGPGGIGSYLARQEFGSNDGQPSSNANGQPQPGDSGYVSHGSGGHYPKMQLPVSFKNI